MTSEDRFWSSTNRDTGCWIWQKSLNRGGYGQVNFQGTIILTHRLAYKIAIGQIPIKMCVCHSCDVRSCINPKHLFLGTRTENNQDMFRKGRGFKFDGTHIVGIANCNAKLTSETALEARVMRASGSPLRAIASRFGVTEQAIWSCVHGLTWKHVGGTIRGTIKETI